MTAALHLIALNFLYAKIVGRRVRLKPAGSHRGVDVLGRKSGRLRPEFAIPITAAVKAVCDNVDSLQPYGKLLGDESAANREFSDENSNALQEASKASRKTLPVIAAKRSESLLLPPWTKSNRLYDRRSS